MDELLDKIEDSLWYGINDQDIFHYSNIKEYVEELRELIDGRSVRPDFETDEDSLIMMSIMGIDAWCGKCTSALSESEKYCPECGRKIDWSDEKCE